VANTIPSDSHVVGNSGHTTDHNNIADMLTLISGFNVKNTAYGGGAVGNGVADDTTAIQAALTAARTAGGGIVIVPPGTYLISQSLQIGTNTWLQGAGYGCTAIKAVNSFAATQVGSNTGMVMLATYANGSTTVTNISVTGITFNGNQANIGSIPGYADNPECSPISLWNCDQVTIAGCSVINSIGFSLYCQNITHFTIQGNYIVSGQGGTSWVNQDGIHIAAGGTTQYGVIAGNFVNTGTGSSGDDCIALQSYGTLADIIVSGNVLSGGGGGNGITIPLSATSATASNIVIDGNDIQSNQGTGIYVYEDGGASGWLVNNLAITGNTFAAWNGAANGNWAIGLIGIWEDVVISGNAIAAPVSAAGGVQGIYASGGTNIAIAGNRIAGLSGAATTDCAIQVGAATGTTTGFSVTGNICTTTGSTSCGIIIENATSGSVAGNTLTGALGTGSYGVELLSDGTAVTGVAVTGNRITSYATGVAEVNTSGTGAHNACVGNALNGCTTTVGTFSGTGDANTGNAT
jgi:polygalacturonase